MIRSNQCDINFGTKIKKLYLTFVIYAVIGWLYEVFLEVVVYSGGYIYFGYYLACNPNGTIIDTNKLLLYN